jgi:hypothetical protein
MSTRDTSDRVERPILKETVLSVTSLGAIKRAVDALDVITLTQCVDRPYQRRDAEANVAENVSQMETVRD